MVQNTNPLQRRRRPAAAGLTLLCLAWGSNFAVLPLLLPLAPAQALAPNQSDGKKSEPKNNQPKTNQVDSQPVTRINRPGVAPAPDEIKFMPAQPVVDPITPKAPAPTAPVTSTPPAPPAAPAPNQSGFPPVAPPINKSRPAQLGPGGEDPYPTIGKLEGLTLGVAQPTTPITERLARLENAVFKRVYSDDSLFDRTDRLKKTILGPDVLDPNSAAARDRDDYLNGLGSPGLGGLGGGLMPESGLGQDIDTAQAVHYLDELAAKPENREAATPAALTQFALDTINYERRNAGNGPLVADPVAESVAGTHVQELAKRAVLSHFSSAGDNPDRRYTLSGGNDAMVESIASVKCAEVGNKKCSKAAMAKTIRALLGRQDDRDALLSPDATHLGVAMALSADGDKLLSTFAVVTRHGVIDPLPTEVAVGDKLEIKGTMEAPYIFDRINIAWEAYNAGGNASSADESEDALPYFPPLDYVAYANHADHDYSKAIFALKAAGVVAAIAGGMFMPPVALAAPLIMMAGNGTGEVRPVSDIPVKGGVKVEGSSFNARVPISNSNKEGLYYITVYGSLGSHAQQSVAVSRRVILARIMPKSESGQASRPATKYDEEVSAQADLKNSPGTTSGADEKYAAKSDKTSTENSTRENAPAIFTPESKPDAKPEVKADSIPEAK